MNLFRDGISRQPDESSDDDIQRNVESLVASIQPEAVDVSPAVGFDMGRAIWVRTMNFIALGS